ncbi:MAG: site-specific integrase [Burkholderiales bacterium]
MLKAVIDGATYETVATQFGVTRTAVERRIKSLAIHLSKAGSINGLNAQGAAFVRRLRQHREAILAALPGFEPPAPFGPRETRVVSGDEIAQAAQRIKGRSQWPWHDLSLFYMLFATGARPLEIARLEVRDYLDASGDVRCESALRAEAAITGKARPLYFHCTRLDQALAPYLQERLDRQMGLGEAGAYRGLDPLSRLFLSQVGEGFRITPYGSPGQQRFLCRPILETYRKLFRYAELRDVTPLSVRHTVAARLYARGADEEQVGLLLGISDRSAVRELFPRPKPMLAQLVDELI